jgi:hypothetical protein
MMPKGYTKNRERTKDWQAKVRRVYMELRDRGDSQAEIMDALEERFNFFQRNTINNMVAGLPRAERMPAAKEVGGVSGEHLFFVPYKDNVVIRGGEIITA